jgi:nicotinate-nucleotide adenylyltransferase
VDLPSLEGVHRLGLLGGTFDPIHNGHIALAEYCAYHAALDRVWFIPSATPPHKHRTDLTPADLRWELTQAAVEPYLPRFSAVDIELRRGGRSYTVDTLQQIRDAVNPDVELFWIVGRDNLSEFPRWHEPKRIVELATVLAGGRPGAAPPSDMPDWFRKRLMLLDGPDVDISSTGIRASLAQGVIPPDALPAPVAEAIVRHGLYGFPQSR